jgi:hypothetical protein
MKQICKTLISIGAVATAVLLLALASPRIVHAYSEEPVFILNPATHPAVVEEVPHLASHLVTLWAGESGLFVQRVDGVQTGTPFVVPAGQSFVITSVDINPNNQNAGYVSIESTTSPGLYGVWLVPGNVSTELQFPSGIVVGSGNNLLSVVPYGYVVFLHGYLTPG